MNTKEWEHVADLAQSQALRDEAAQLKWAARYKVIEARRREETAVLNLWGSDIHNLTVSEWQNGNDIPSAYRYDDSFPTLLRIKGDQMETTHGAYVPVKDAITLWHKIKAKEDVKGFKIGYYEVSGIHDGKLIVGCHRIPVREVSRMAHKLGLEVTA